MSYTNSNWTCLSPSLNQGQETIIPFGGSPTVINAPNIFIYGSPTDTTSEIITTGYFNSTVTELPVGDWIIGNSSDGSFLIFISNITNGVVTVSFVFDNNGPYLLKAANGSDAQNVTTFVENLGLGRPGILTLTDADFSAAGGTYILTNPPPIIIDMSATSPGRVLQLPPQNQPTSLQASDQIEIITIGSPEAIGINNGAGTLIFLIEPDSAWRAIPNNRSTVTGAWVFLGEVQTINGNTGDVELIWQGIQNADPSGAFQVIFPKGYEIRSFNNSPVFNIGDFTTLRGYNVQQSFTADINLNSSLGKPFVGAVQISDDVSVHNVKLSLNSALSNDIQMWIITGVTNGVDIQVPAGVTLNGVDGSVTPTLSLDPGRNLAQLVRTGINSYNVYSNSIGSETLQDAYSNGDGTITIEDDDNNKPFAVGRDEANPDTDGVYVSATRNLEPSPSLAWNHFFEANNSSAVMTKYGALSCIVQDPTAGAEISTFGIGACVPGSGVMPFFICNGQNPEAVPSGDLHCNFRIIDDAAGNGDPIHDLQFWANNNASFLFKYANIQSFIGDNSAGSEAGIVAISVALPGGYFPFITLDGTAEEIQLNVPLNMLNGNIINVGNYGTNGSSNSTSAQLQLNSTNQGALVNRLTTSQFAGISGKAGGLLAFDTTKTRFTVWDSTTVRDIAYVSDSKSATYTPTLTNVSGTTTLTLVKAQYTAIKQTAGNIVNVTIGFTFVATAITQTITISIPFGSNLSTIANAILMGGSIYSNGTPGIGDGQLLDVFGSPAAATVQLNMQTLTGIGQKNVSVSFSYVLQ